MSKLANDEFRHLVIQSFFLVSGFVILIFKCRAAARHAYRTRLIDHS
ncbi:MAG: hypothetical protein CEN92_463, partial [Candidatus Berkelbacteria bacterium Licking1014_96]